MAACHAPEVDVLVLAGDVAEGERIGPALALFSERYPHVVYVHGNHEFFGSTRERVIELTRETCARLGNVHWLDARVVELGGKRFVGASLWYPASEATVRYRDHLTDLRHIADYASWVHREHARAKAFLERSVEPGDIVVTHHLPTAACVRSEYRDHPLNCYFVGHVEHVMHAQRPALWLHGHTHGSVDMVCGETRIVCNPHGYLGRDENRAFEPRLLIEV